MNYHETLHYLYEHLPMYHRIGAPAYKADLTNTITLCKILNEPHRKFRSVHVAGTNGKGSVSHILASVFQESGLKTGLYTSPHLKDFRERIRINGVMIPEEEVCSFVQKHRQSIEKINPSFFELTVALAFDHFAQHEVDIAVIETGLGGRLDSTNVVTPVLSVITNIGMDHMAFLGTTLPQIAREKAGIIKKGIPVVVGEYQEEAAFVFEEVARQMEAPLCYADSETLENNPLTIHHSPLTIHHSPFTTDLAGTFQQKNIRTSLKCIEVLRNSIGISDEQITAGVQRVKQNSGLRGRWETISHSPLTICDVGHNEPAIAVITQEMRSLKSRQLHVVFGMVSDKDADAILALLPSDARYYFCCPPVPRGLNERILKEKARGFHLKGKEYPSVQAAYRAATEDAVPEDFIFIGGSTFVVAEVL